MEVLLFLLLAGYAVKCNEQDNNNYIISAPQPVDRRRSMLVYWNVPTMQCASKKVYFSDLYQQFGIIQNQHDRFRGEKITILYDPGFFPAIVKNTTSNQYRLRNGGVPQEGNYDDHAIRFAKDIEDQIPDPDFDGIGVIDFESWRPMFRQNWGTLEPYKNVSYEIERQKHWWWPKNLLEGVARARFEKAGRVFMLDTLTLAKKLRPKALWGYYAYPYCYNTKNSVCSDDTMMDNDRMDWLWTESTALFPSIYSSQSLPTNQLVAVINGRIREAARVRKHSLILPYFWYRYRDGGFLDQKDLDAILSTIYESSASGLIIWGSSFDVNAVDKCQDLLQYVNSTLGPAIARYTKQGIFQDPPEEVSVNNETNVVSENNRRSGVESDTKVHPTRKITNIDVQLNNDVTTTETERIDFDRVVEIYENLNNDTLEQLDNNSAEHDADMIDLLLTFMRASVCDCSNCDCKNYNTESTITNPTEFTTVERTAFTDRDYVVEVATEKSIKCNENQHAETTTESATSIDPLSLSIDKINQDSVSILKALRQKILCNSRLLAKIIQAFPTSDIASLCMKAEKSADSYVSLLTALKESDDTELEKNIKKHFKEDMPNIPDDKIDEEFAKLLQSIEKEEHISLD